MCARALVNGLTGTRGRGGAVTFLSATATPRSRARSSLLSLPKSCGELERTSVNRALTRGFAAAPDSKVDAAALKSPPVSDGTATSTTTGPDVNNADRNDDAVDGIGDRSHEFD